MSNFLIAFHTPTNSGYAIEPLEKLFYAVVADLVGSEDRIHLGYTNCDEGAPRWLGGKSFNYIEMRYSDSIPAQAALTNYVRTHHIKYVLAFDLGVQSVICRALRAGGVSRIISYWGAPMSALSSGAKLLAKRVEVSLRRSKPDHFIFESYGMRRFATHGRGIAAANTSVVRLGIDLREFNGEQDKRYVYRELGIPQGTRIFFYCGHMEKRKGVDVIVKAAAELINKRKVEAIHFVLCGNKNGEERVFDNLYKSTAAENFITFAGYRSDIKEILSGCYAGIIASSGWDSFPRSSIEMAASYLPLIVSDLPGLNETVIPEETGLLFPPGDHIALADCIEALLASDQRRTAMGVAARQRAENEFTLALQHSNLKNKLRMLTEV